MKKLHWPTIHAWALFDFGAIAFSMNIFSTYFALWAIKDHGASDLTYGLTKSLAMLAVALISPMIGALSDRAGTRKPYLLACVLLYVLSGLVMGVTGNLYVGLVLFGVASLAYQFSTVFYNAMLQSLATPETMGRISGYGKALSYLGSLTAVIMGTVFATGQLFGMPTPLPVGGSQAVFIPTALLALGATLPLLLIKHPTIPAATSHRSWRQMIADVKDTRKLPGVGMFLLASFFFFDPLNTIRDFMSVYMVKVIGLSETGGSLQKFLVVVVLSSLAGAVLWGFVADRFGAKKALIGVLATMSVALGGLVFITSPALVTGILAPMLGMGFGGAMVATRPYLAQLVPPDRQGEFFGLFILANDFAAILGPLSWGVIVEVLKAQGVVAYQAAVAFQLVFMVIGLALVLKVPDPRTLRVSEPELPRAAEG